MEKIINYTLDTEGIYPGEPICAGYQGEHRATAIVFTPTAELSEELSKRQGEGSRFKVKTEFITEAGEIFSGEETDIERLGEPFFITSEMSESGLDSKVLLTLTETDSEGGTSEFLRADLSLYFLSGRGYSVAVDQKQEVDLIEKKTAEALILIEGKCAEAEGIVSQGVSEMQRLQLTSANQLKKTILASSEAEASAESADESAERSEKSATLSSDEAKKAKEYCVIAGDFCKSAGQEALLAREYAEKAEAVAEEMEKIAAGSENKQDKFADLTERDGILTLIAGRELQLEGIDSRKDPTGYLKLLFGTAELGSYGTATVSSAVDDVKLSGQKSVYDQANVNVDGCRIRNLADPIFDRDAVNKAYLDGVIGDIEGVIDAVIALQEQYIGGEA